MTRYSQEGRESDEKERKRGGKCEQRKERSWQEENDFVKLREGGKGKKTFKEAQQQLLLLFYMNFLP
jgi:hypothetical protein